MSHVNFNMNTRAIVKQFQKDVAPLVAEGSVVSVYSTQVQVRLVDVPAALLELSKLGYNVEYRGTWSDVAHYAVIKRS